MTHNELLLKYEFLKKLAFLALAGVAGLSIAFGASSGMPHSGFGLFLLLVLPFFLYIVLLVVWHWKARYIGQRSNLWGALIVIETSGWFKLIYIFRHIIPDVRGTGRYKRSTEDE